MKSRPEIEQDRIVFSRYLRRPTRRSLERVVRHFHSRVWRNARRLTGNEEDAADLAQDVFLSLLLKPPREGSVPSPAGYLTFRVLTLARRLERSRRRRRQREAIAATRLLDSAAALPIDIEAVREAIGDLPEPIRAAIELRYLGRFRNREVAEVLSVSERSVEEYLRVGRETLRARLGGVALGALAALSGAHADSYAQAPRAALASALKVVRLGPALAPLSECLSLPAPSRGGLSMKKSVAGILLLGVIAWLVISNLRAPAPSEAPPGPSGAPTVTATEGRDFTALTGADAADSRPAARAEVATPPRADLRRLVAGVVLDEKGRPVGDAHITACLIRSESISHGRLPELVAQTDTDEEGRFVLEGVPVAYRKTLSVTATKPGFATASAGRFLIPTAGDEVLLVLERDVSSVRGRIVDERGQAVPGAHVCAFSRSAPFGLLQIGALATGGAGQVVSDAEGRFRLEGLRASTPVHLSVAHPRYRGHTAESVLPGGPEVEIRLRGGFLFAGEVVDRAGRPVAGVGVALRGDESRWGWPPHHERTLSGPDGSFALFAVPAGVYSVLVEPPAEYILPPAADVVEIARPTTGYRITLDAGARVEGYARVDGDGAALPGGVLTVHTGGGSRTLETYADGSFRCAVKPGPVTVVPSTDARGLYRALGGGELTGRVEEGGVLRGDVWFVPRSDSTDDPGAPAIRGRVVDPAGHPVRALVALSDDPRGPGFNGHQETTLAGSDGRFAFPASSFPAARALAVDPFHRLVGEQALGHAHEGTEIVIHLSPYSPPRVHGVIRRANGAPIPRASVLVSRSGGMAVNDAAFARADEAGRFLVPDLLPDTYYHFHAVVEDRTAPSVQLKFPGGEASEIDLVFPPDALLEGRVTDLGGRPLPGLRVTVRVGARTEWQTTPTDDAGRFKIELLPATYHVYVEESGFGIWSMNVEVPTTLDISLTPTRRVTFEAVGPDGLPLTSLSIQQEVQRWGMQTLLRPSGRYEVEAREDETELRLANPRFEPRTMSLHWPPTGPLDLGRLEFARRSDDDTGAGSE